MKTYFKNLDALRFLAFLSVLFSHAVLFFGYESRNGFFESIKHPLFVHGDLGVNFFFVLSGFLITFFLFSEKKENGKIVFSSFYLKKILRIFPLYFMVVLLGFFVVYPIALKSQYFFSFSSIAPINTLPWYLLFVVNFKMAFWGVTSLTLAVLWAVAVEVQFYIFWPLIISLFSFKNILRIFIFLILTSFIYRFFYYENYNILQYSTFSVMSDLVIGGLAAYVTLFLNRTKSLLEKIPRHTIVLIYILGLMLVFSRGFLPNVTSGLVYRIAYTLEPVVFSVFFAFIILEQNLSKNSFLKFGDCKILNYLGKRSFGLYCYHVCAMFFTVCIFNILGITKGINNNFYIFILEVIIAFLLTLTFSLISYRFFEKKFLTLKQKYN